MQKTYKLDPVATSTHGSTDLTSLSSFSYEKVGDETVLGSDGKPFIQGAYYDNLSYTVTVNGYDNNINIGVGDNETLTLKGSLRENGDGVGAGITFIFENAVCSGSSNTINHAGNSETSWTFRVVSTDGAADPLTVS